MEGWAYPLTTDPMDARVAVVWGTKSEAVARLAIPPGRTVAKVTLLIDRTFRDAWSLGEAGLVVDLPRARAIHMERVRRRRNQKLAETDALMTRALESGDSLTLTPLKNVRQRLRDLPALIQADVDAAADPATLHAIWPSELT